MFSNILVALDGSEGSQHALTTAATLCKEQGSQLFLLHVVNEVELRFGKGELAVSVNEINRALHAEGEELLSKATAQVSDVQVTTKLVTGNPAEQIVSFANENGIDLIVIGSRGLGAVKELVLGSVSHKVVQLAACPVFIVK